jgi:glutamate-1-semialdehyde 2,1-aminomutase
MTESTALRARWDAAMMPNYGTPPLAVDHGQGVRLWDVDGREYLDFVCSFGPIVLGHAHPAVEAAVERQRALADCQNGPSPRMVELAERLVDLVPHADWAMFGKNGTDATTLALSIARAARTKCAAI